MAEKPLMSIKDVARRLLVNTTTVYRLVQRGELPGFKVGQQWRFKEEVLEAWIADQATVEVLRRESHDPSTSTDDTP